MGYNKVEQRLENLDVSRRFIEQEMIGIKKHIDALDNKLGVHIIKLQDAVRLLELKSWAGIGSDVLIFLTTLITLILTLRHH
jgi:hypothetical protein